MDSSENSASKNSLTFLDRENTQRAAVIAAARSWLKTPYVHMGRVKGAGADCLTLIAECYTDAGVIKRPKIPYYPQDFMHHRDAERYLEGVLRYAREIPYPPRPGDIAVWKFGRTYSHGAIVIEWPNIIHSFIKIGVVEEDAERAVWLKYIGENVGDRGKLRPVKFFSYWAA